MNQYRVSFFLPVEATASKIWKYYINTSLRKLWEIDLEEFKIDGSLKTGAKGYFKLQGMPGMEFILSKFIDEQEFTEQFFIPNIGILYFSHQVEKVSENQVMMKAIISLSAENSIDSNSCYHFLKQVSDDIIDKAFKLKELVEK